MPDGLSSSRLEDLQMRWQQDPDSRVYLQLAEEYRKLDRHPEAIDVLKRGLKSRPNDLSGQVALGRCHLEMDENDAAAQALELVVGRDPTHIVGNKLLLEAYLQSGDATRAGERLELYKLLNPADPDLGELDSRLRRLRQSQPAAPARPAPAAPEAPGPPPVSAPRVSAPPVSAPPVSAPPVSAPRVSAPPVESPAAKVASRANPFETWPGKAAVAAAQPSGPAEPAWESPTAPAEAKGPAAVPESPGAAAESPVFELEEETPEEVSVESGEEVLFELTPQPMEPRPVEQEPQPMEPQPVESSDSELLFEPPPRPPSREPQWSSAAGEDDIFDLGPPAPPPSLDDLFDLGPVQPAPSLDDLWGSAPEPPVTEAAAAEAFEEETVPEPLAEVTAPEAYEEEAVFETYDEVATSEAFEEAALAEPYDEAELAEPYEEPLAEPYEEPAVAEPYEEAAVAGPYEEAEEAVLPEPFAVEAAPEPAGALAPEPFEEPEEPFADFSVAEPAEEVADVELFEEEPAAAPVIPEPAGELAGRDAEPAEADEPEPATATLGELYLKQGHVEEAERIFRLVLQQNPRSAAAMAGLARIRGEKGLTAHALLARAGREAPTGLTAKKIRILKSYAQLLRQAAGRIHVQ